MYRRLHFTLLELLIVLAIIATLAGVIGINVTNAIREQRFRSEVDAIVDKLRLAQDLMLIFHSNIDVRIATNENQKGFLIELVPEVVLPLPWLKEVMKPKELLYIHSISFSGLQSEVNELRLHFRSGGSSMSKGALHLSTADHPGPGVLTQYVVLTGSPAPIQVSSTPPEESLNTTEESFYRELTVRTIEAIRAKEQ